jgi:hypothetical protein
LCERMESSSNIQVAICVTTWGQAVKSLRVSSVKRKSSCIISHGILREKSYAKKWGQAL